MRVESRAAERQEIKKYLGNLKTLYNYCLVLSPPPEMKILLVLIQSPEKQKLNFSRNALFHMKTSVCLKYFVNYWFLHRLSIVSISVKKFCNIQSFIFQLYQYQNANKCPKKTAFFLEATRLQFFD